MLLDGVRSHRADEDTRFVVVQLERAELSGLMYFALLIDLSEQTWIFLDQEGLKTHFHPIERKWPALQPMWLQVQQLKALRLKTIPYQVAEALSQGGVPTGTLWTLAVLAISVNS